MIYGEYTINDLTFYIVKEGRAVKFISNIKDEFQKRYPNIVRDDAACEDVSTQLDAYFKGNLKSFDLNLDPDGTPFQHEVWNVLRSLEYGEVLTYSDIAQKLGDPNKVRAAASAIGKNPIMIVVPCHRVIGKDGKLHGFAGGLDLKQTLLNVENGL